MRRSRLLILLLILAPGAHACASNAPPTLSPTGTVAWQTLRAVKALNVLRDVAVAANEQTPPVLSTAVTREVVEYHRSALVVIQQLPNGWKPSVSASLDQLILRLPPDAKRQLGPYLQLVQIVLQQTLLAQLQPEGGILCLISLPS